MCSICIHFLNELFLYAVCYLLLFLYSLIVCGSSEYSIRLKYTNEGVRETPIPLQQAYSLRLSRKK